MTEAEQAKYSILGRARAVDIVEDPYPHLLLHDALPQDLYDELAAGFPGLDYVAGADAGRSNLATLSGADVVLGDPQISSAWQNFFRYHLSGAFFREFVELWAPTIEQQYPDLVENFGKPLDQFDVGVRARGRTDSQQNLLHDIVLDCVFGMNTPVTEPSRVRGPHIDIPHKLFSSLLYFREPDDDSEGGEYQLFRMKRRIYPQSMRKKIPLRFVEAQINVPYRANTLIVWLNGARSVHAVSPRSITPFPRRYVAITGECYGGRERAGYFARHPQWHKPLDRARSWLNL